MSKLVAMKRVQLPISCTLLASIMDRPDYFANSSMLMPFFFAIYVGIRDMPNNTRPAILLNALPCKENKRKYECCYQYGVTPHTRVSLSEFECVLVSINESI